MTDAPTDSPRRASRGRSLAGALAAVAVVAYPFVIYASLTRWGPRTTAALLLGVLVLWGLRARLFGRVGFRSLVVQVGGIALLSLGTLWSDNPAYIQQMPVLISAFLLVTFVTSLLRPPTMIERYARLVTPDLSDAEVRHCRGVTWAWIAFFVANAAIAETLAIVGPVEAWALYAGGIAYVLMGGMFAVEYVIRKARFGRFGDRWHDRLLARLLGRRAGDVPGEPGGPS